MTAPNLDLPMLYGYALEEMLSCHDGVRCYRATRRDTTEEYILKVISIPASKSKLEALLLSGALADRKAARVYFKQLAQDLLRQAELLRQLSQQEGFAPFLDSGMCPMEDGVGYYVCLLGTQKASLEGFLNSENLTHADILHMGLDLCAALAASRRAGMLYADLKPGNIFYAPEQGCRIGDVGFIALPSLNYTCLPDKYRSRYTAPELYDDYAVLNPSVDVYALGMVLYQAYNGGSLPFDGAAPTQALPTPLYADYEMEKLLAKACHPDPAQRWQDPTQFAKALMEYMQQFGAPETPIIPPVVELPEVPEEEVEEFLPEADSAELQAEMELLQEDEAMDPISQDATETEEAPTRDEEIAEEMLPGEEGDMQTQEDAQTVPEEPVETVTEEEPAEEVLLPVAEEAALEEEPPVRQRKTGKWLGIAALLLASLGLFFGFKHYYDHIYTLHVQSLVLTNSLDALTVQVQTDGEEALLRVICSDGGSDRRESAVTDGTAHFTQLNPNTRYTVEVVALGNHRVIGHTSDSFTTAEVTKIHDFTATIGPEDCSVILNFTVEGPNPDSWILRYRAEGIEEQTQTFTGRTITVYGLVDRAEYTFTLEPQTQLYMDGKAQVTYRATNLLYAKNLQVIACKDGNLTLQWQQPDNGTAQQWRVRCYNDDGYDVTVTTEDCSYTFTKLTQGRPCNVEVTAVGMHHSISIRVPADPITIENFTCTLTDDGMLQASWEYMGSAPIGGWLIALRIDGQDVAQLVAEENELLLMLLPGSTYEFGFIAPPGGLILQDWHSYTASEVPVFAGFGLDTAQLQSNLCLQPGDAVEDWAAYLQESGRSQFLLGEAAAILLQTDAEVEAAEEAVTVRFVIGSADGRVLHTESIDQTWSGLWQDGACCLAPPELPQEIGSYTLVLYFNGQFVVTQEFTVV